MPLVVPSHVWDFAGIMLVILLAAAHGRIGRVAPFWQIIYTLPGTALHELAHFLVALLTGGRPSGFSIIPRSSLYECDNGIVCRRWVLGSVTIRNPGIFSALPTGLAPLFLNLAAYYLYLHWFGWFPRDGQHTLLMYGALFLLCSSSLPSLQDFKVACSNIAGLLLYAMLCLVALIFRNEILAVLR